MSAETTVKLGTDFKNIIAVKEASGDLGQIMQIIQNKPDDFLVISGDDAITLPMLSLGGDGVVSVVTNAFPSEFSSMVSAALIDDIETARMFHYGVLNIIDPLFEEGNPAGVKEVLKFKRVCENFVRLPLCTVSDNLSQLLVELTKNIENLSKLKS